MTASGEARGPAGTVRVWDRAVRALHLALASSVVLGWLSGYGLLHLLRWHEWAGHAASLAVAMRMVWGFCGSGHARFGSFVRGWRDTRDYAQRLWAGTAPRHLGHNPLGGWMTLALLAGVASLGVTGFLLGTDAFWGDPLMAELHHALAVGLMGLVALHLIGALMMSLVHRELLPLAMLTGRKRAERADRNQVEVNPGN